MYARREVIVSAGPINSPKLLKLSGVGPAQELSLESNRRRTLYGVVKCAEAVGVLPFLDSTLCRPTIQCAPCRQGVGDLKA